MQKCNLFYNSFIMFLEIFPNTEKEGRNMTIKKVFIFLTLHVLVVLLFSGCGQPIEKSNPVNGSIVSTSNLASDKTPIVTENHDVIGNVNSVTNGSENTEAYKDKSDSDSDAIKQQYDPTDAYINNADINTTQKPSINTDASTNSVNTSTADRNSNQATDIQTPTDGYENQPDKSACTHHKASGENFIRTVTWTENNTHRIWTCTQCGATGKELKPSSDTTPSATEEKTELSTDKNNPTETTTNTDTATKDTESTNVNAEQIKPTSPYDAVAKEGTEELLAERLIYYINQYREEEGNVTAVVLPGLTKYAGYRSKQLSKNFAHDTDDERAAATSLRYGRYIDPAKWGDSGEPFYSAEAQEAIGQYAVFSPCTIDEVAKRLSTAFRNSSGHWDYVGASATVYKNYKYIACGAFYQNGVWYACICVIDTNIYDKFAS